MARQLIRVQDWSKDRSLVSTFTHSRIDPEMKLRVELQYAAQLIQRNPQLAECDPESIRTAMLDVASSGLTLSPSLAHAYLIPYGKTCTFHPGYKGIMHLCYRANTLARIQPGLHKNGDGSYKRWTDETGAHLIHHESDAADRSKRDTLHAYVIVKLTNGETIITDIDREGLARIEWAATHRYDAQERKWVQNPKGGMVWRGKFRDQMCLKAAIRRSSNYWPRDDGGRLEHAIQVMDRYDPVVFEQEPQPTDSPAGELLIDETQQLQLHAVLTDHGLEPKKADEWLRRKADALGYQAIDQLPARLFEDVRAFLTEQVKRYMAEYE